MKCLLSIIERLLRRLWPIAAMAASIFVVQGQTLNIVEPKPQAITAPLYRGNTVGLNWQRSPDTNVVGYYVYWGTNGARFNNSTKLGNITNCVIDQLPGGFTNYFSVSGYNASGAPSQTNPIASTYIYPRLDITREIFTIRVDAPNRTNQWQISADGVNWATIATVITNAGARITLYRTNSGGVVEFIRLQ